MAFGQVSGSPASAKQVRELLDTAMSLENLAVPQGERILLAGYETGRWIGVPDAAT